MASILGILHPIFPRYFLDISYISGFSMDYGHRLNAFLTPTKTGPPLGWLKDAGSDGPNGSDGCCWEALRSDWAVGVHGGFRTPWGLWMFMHVYGRPQILGEWFQGTSIGIAANNLDYLLDKYLQCGNISWHVWTWLERKKLRVAGAETGGLQEQPQM